MWVGVCVCVGAEGVRQPWDADLKCLCVCDNRCRRRNDRGQRSGSWGPERHLRSMNTAAEEISTTHACCLWFTVCTIAPSVCTGCVLQYAGLSFNSPPPAPLYDLPDGVFTLTAERALWGSVTIGQLQAEIRIGFISQWRLFCEKATKGLLGGGKGQADEAHCCPADEQILAGSCGQQAGRGLGYSLASCRAAPFEMHLDLQVPTTLLIFVVFLPCFGVFLGGVRHKYLFCGSVTYMDVLYSNMDLKHIYLNYVI